MTRNIARDVEMPKGIQPADREPYTEEEMVAILNACDVIGQRPYERLRARAMVLLMRYTGLSIRNTFLLRRDQIHDGRLEVRRAKNGKPICVPVMLDLQAALDAVPVPRRAQDPNCPYFFYSGRVGIPIEYAQRSAEGTMNAVFRRSGVQNAKAHRFRTHWQRGCWSRARPTKTWRLFSGTRRASSRSIRSGLTATPWRLTG